jgi:ribose-phosphate pyrophosphokinase
MEKRLVVSCSGAKHLAKSIAKKSKAKYSEIRLDRFPDTEIRVRLPKVKGKKVFFIQSFYPQKNNINDKVIEILFAAYTARELGAKKLFLVAPYLAYMREDKRFEKGEAINAKIISKLFKIFDKIYVVEPHLHRFKKLSDFFPNATKISLSKDIVSYIKKNIPKPYILVGPDEESQQWVKPIANQLNSKYIILKKKRFTSRKVKVSGKKVQAEKVVIIDDIISTGYTMIEVAKKIPGKKYFIGIHGLFSENALAKLRKKGKVITSNTIPSSVSKIDCSDVISKIIK